MAKLLTPLAPNVPIVDKEGNPNPYFQRIMQELTDARVSASLIDALGGDPDVDAFVMWDDSTGDLTFYSVNDLADLLNISELLDTIDDTHGAILYRDSASWQVLAPGTDGDVLTTHGAGADPTWETPSSSGGGSGYFNGYTGALGGVDSSAYATKGHLYTPSMNVEIDSLFFIIDSNGTYECTIAEVNTTTGEILDIIGTSNTVGSLGIAWWNKLTFGTPAALTAGTNYAILLVRTGGAGTDSCSLTSLQNGFMNAPGAIRGEANKLLKYATVGVSLAQTADVVSAGAMYNMALEGRIV